MPIEQQIKTVVEEATLLGLNKLFHEITAHHGRAKEAMRWTSDDDVGDCIKLVDQYFSVHWDEEEVQEIKNDLPAGVTILVVKHCSFGGLKYPDRKLYT